MIVRIDSEYPREGLTQAGVAMPSDRNIILSLKRYVYAPNSPSLLLNLRELHVAEFKEWNAIPQNKHL